MEALWTPSPERIAQSNLTQYRNWLKEKRGLSLDTYDALWNWSVTERDAFWKSIWEYFDVMHDGTIATVVQGSMPTCTWFEGTSLNYAEHIFRKATNAHPAIIFQAESSPLQEISWVSLRQQVASLQHHFKAQGIQAGDRIVAYMPACPEATIAFLAANALGAVWSSCSPDFGTGSVVDRFAQIEPKILVATDSYNYGGKTFDRAAVVSELIAALPTLKEVIVVSTNDKAIPQSKTKVVPWRSVTIDAHAALQFVRVPFSHPIWILYSSGTTGLPKAITHSQGGILLEQLKYGTFHNNFKAGERCFWYTTTGWMMWNYIHGSLLAGGTMVLYDGSPAYPDLNALWKFCQDARIHHFGTSAGFILENIKKDIHPNTFDLSALRSISSTGSTLPPEGFDWIYREVKHDLWLASMSGGTDVCSAFVGGNPTLPVYTGEIQCRALGCKLEAFDDDGNAVTDEVGEMVITAPMPSMPIFFWNDPGYKRYTESYFEMYPAIWRHGDWIRITPRGGIVIYGRSDATLNRGGIRIGTSEIYRAVDQVSEVKDSLIICIEKDKGEFWMPLFVIMQDGIPLTDDLRKKINTTIRQAYSPRHVPDEIIAVPGIPYTISGKKTETPVKKVLMGQDPKKVVNAGALRNPDSMEFFIRLKTKD
jgi:acetoacetyl-CoA synthetase